MGCSFSICSSDIHKQKQNYLKKYSWAKSFKTFVNNVYIKQCDTKPEF